MCSKEVQTDPETTNLIDSVLKNICFISIPIPIITPIPVPMEALRNLLAAQVKTEFSEPLDLSVSKPQITPPTNYFDTQ